MPGDLALPRKMRTFLQWEMVWVWLLMVLPLATWYAMKWEYMWVSANDSRGRRWHLHVSVLEPKVKINVTDDVFPS